MPDRSNAVGGMDCARRKYYEIRHFETETGEKLACSA
jgi:hypothetical protein